MLWARRRGRPTSIAAPRSALLHALIGHAFRIEHAVAPARLLGSSIIMTAELVPRDA
jgi:hypothetical protein